MNINLPHSLRTSKDINYIKKIENILKKQCQKENTEVIIGIFSNHSSVDRYVLMPKSIYRKEVKKERDYPKLSMLYYDLAWFKRKKRRLKKWNSMKK